MKIIDSSIYIYEDSEKELYHLLAERGLLEEIDKAEDGEEKKVIILFSELPLFVLTARFIDQCKKWRIFLNFVEKKDYSNPIERYDSDTKTFIEIKADRSDAEKCMRVLDGNNIEGFKGKKACSINALHEVFSNDKESNIKTINFLDYLILRVISPKTVEGKGYLEFFFGGDENRFSKRFNIKKEEKVLDLYCVYDWIFNDKEFKDAYKIKLKLVRNIISQMGTITNGPDLLAACENSYAILVNDKTEQYFKQVNNIKDDQLRISKELMSINRAIELAVIGLLLTCVSKISILADDTKRIETFWFCGAMIVCLLFILWIYKLEMENLQQMRKNICEMYSQHIFFNTVESKHRDSKEESENIPENYNKIIKKPECNTDLIWIIKFLIAIFGLTILFLVWLCNKEQISLVNEFIQLIARY